MLNREEKIKVIISAVIIIFNLFIWFILLTAEHKGGKAPDARRESDIRQISLAQEMFWDQYGTYATLSSAEIRSEPGRIPNTWGIGTYLSPIPTDPGGGDYTDCNDKVGGGYLAYVNWPEALQGSSSQYCIYACLDNGRFFAASEKGTAMLEKAPTSLDCW